MSRSLYLFFHKDHPLTVDGINSGAENATLFLARALASAGNKVIVCAQLTHEERSVGDVEYWNLGEGFDVAGALKRVRAVGRYHLISACRGLPILLSLNEPQCLTRTFIAHDPTSGAVGIKPAILSKIADNMVCVSAAQKELFVKDGADPARVQVIPNGADLNRFTPGDPSKREYRKFAFVGALVLHKGIDILIEAFARLAATVPGVTLDVFGSSSLWGVEELFDQREIEKKVPGLTFHGNVPQQRIARAFRESGACIIPSRWFDSFPLTAVEAQVSGCPVIGFDVGGIREAILPGETGILLSEISVDSLYGTLQEMVSNPTRLQRMSQAALDYARKTFTWERTAASLIALIEKAATSGFEASGRLGVMTTWNQECGLARTAECLLNEMEPDSFEVFAEESSELTRADESFVTRCWKRGINKYDALERAVVESGIRLLLINCHDRFFVYPEFSKVMERLQGRGIRIIAYLHSTFTVTPELSALADAADKVIVHTTQNRLEVIASGARPDKVSVVPLGVEVAPPLDRAAKRAARNRFDVRDDEKMIVTFGFIQPHKGMEGVIESTRHLKQRGIKAKTFIVGTTRDDDPYSKPYLAELKRLSREYGVDDCVRFSDEFVSTEILKQYVQASDIVVLNYRSQHHEASLTCSEAVGMGAVVATSLAPAFMPFDDSVWHITSGFPPALSIETLLTNDQVRLEVLRKAQDYCARNNWQRTQEKFLEVYKEVRFNPVVVKKENHVDTRLSGTQQGLKILFQNRSTAFTQRGGDTVVMERLAEELRKLGVSVEIDCEGREDPARYDLVHLFNFAIPDLLRQQGERAKAKHVPFVVTTLCEDIPMFHSTSRDVAGVMIEYVARKQDKGWLEQSRARIGQTPSVASFDNEWIARNAAALYTNGSREADVLNRVYGSLPNIFDVPLGFDRGPAADPSLFCNEFKIKEFVLCVGRIESRKNQLMLLKALEDIDLPVVLAGGGFTYQPDYDHAVRNFGRKGQTLIVGRLSAALLESAYAAAKIHALPSWYELPGLVSLEAAWQGCNVVVTDQGTARDYFGNEAFYCSPDSEDSIRNAVLAAYYGPRSATLRDKVATYTWARTAERTLQSYRALTAQRPQQRATIGAALSTPLGAMQQIQPSQNSRRAEEITERGERAAKEHKYDEALRCFDEAEAIDPRLVRVHRARGAVLLARENVREAKESFAKALTLDPNDSRSLSGTGMCEAAGGNYKVAYDYFVRSLEQEPNQVVTILQLVRCAYVVERFDELAEFLRRFVSEFPNDLEMRFCYAGCLYKLGRIEDADRENKRVLIIDPQHRGGRELDGLIIRGNEARRASPPSAPQPQDIFQVRFDSTDVALLKLEEEKKNSKFEEVAKQCDEILAQPSLTLQQRETATLLKAEAAVLGGSLNEAETLFDQVLQANPSSPRGLSGKGALAAHANQWEKAQDYFQQALQRDPSYDVALAGLGLCSHWMKDDLQAWSWYSKALTYNPENLRALLGIIELGYKLGRLTEVEEAVRNYLEIHPADLEFVYALAGCYFAQNKLQEASLEIEKITLFEPQNEKALELKKLVQDRREGRSSSVNH